MHPYPHKGLTDKKPAVEAIERNPVARTMSLDEMCGYSNLSSRSFLDVGELPLNIYSGFGLKLGETDLHNSHSASLAAGTKYRCEIQIKQSSDAKLAENGVKAVIEGIKLSFHMGGFSS